MAETARYAETHCPSENYEISRNTVFTCTDLGQKSTRNNSSLQVQVTLPVNSNYTEYLHDQTQLFQPQLFTHSSLLSTLNSQLTTPLPPSQH